MPNGLDNWTFRDVKSILEQHGFHLVEGKDIELSQKGSHYLYFVRKEAEIEAIVDAQFKHGTDSYPTRTLETLIRNSLPFLDKKHWRKWAMTGGHCCKDKAWELRRHPSN